METKNENPPRSSADLKPWRDPEVSVLTIDATLSTVPPGSDGNRVGS